MTTFEKALNQPEQKNSTIGNEPIAQLQALLINNPGIYYAWQSSIAMAFVDAVDKYCEERDLPNIERDKTIVTGIANKAAINFLNTLCSK